MLIHADAVFLWTRVRCLAVPQLLMATVLTADGLERYARASAGSRNWYLYMELAQIISPAIAICLLFVQTVN